MWLLFKKRRLHKRLVKWLKMRGCVVNECHQEELSDPEIIACINGSYMAIKLVKNGSKTHISRYKWREKVLRANGQVAFVAPNNFDMFKVRVRQMLEKPSMSELNYEI